MGGKQSTAVSLEMITSVVNENAIAIMKKVKSNNSNLCSTAQQLNIHAGNLTGCDLNITQTSSVVCNLDSLFGSTSDTSLAKVYQQALEQAATNSTKAIQDTLAGPMSKQNTNVSTSVKAYISSKFETNFSSEQSSSCINQAVTTQGQDHYFGNIDCTKSKNGSLNFGQDADISALATCSSTMVDNMLSSDDVLSKTIQEAKSTTSVEQQGLGTILNNLISTYGNMGLALIIGMAILGLGVLFFAGKILLSDAGQAAIGDLSKAGAAKLSK